MRISKVLEFTKHGESHLSLRVNEILKGLDAHVTSINVDVLLQAPISQTKQSQTDRIPEAVNGNTNVLLLVGTSFGRRIMETKQKKHTIFWV